MVLFQDKLASATKNVDLEDLKLLLLKDPQLPNCLEAALESVDVNNQLKIAKLLMDHLDVEPVMSEESRAWAQSVASTKDQTECSDLLFNYAAAFNKVKLFSGEDEDNVYLGTLMKLCNRGYEEIVKMILDQGVRVDERGRQWDAIASCLVISNNFNVIKLFLDSHEETHTMALKIMKIAIMGNRVETIKWILDKGLIIGEPYYAHYIMQLAINESNPTIVQMFVDYGVDVKKKYSRISTHLFIATRGRSREVVEILLTNGVDISTEDDRIFICDPVGHIEIQENLKVLVVHLVQELAEGRSAKDTHLEIIASNEQLKDFKVTCEEELERIRQDKFEGTNVSLYDVWKSNLNQMTALLMNKAIGDSLVPGEIKRTYPIYSDRIIKTLRKGFERKFRLIRVYKFFESLSRREENRLPRLPVTCTRLIFDLLTTEDLIGLRRAYYKKLRL